ncbi:hypothetical protein A3C89_01485 [Candidatus Kaiserbacteria bacterium RIFCSPHIGHO2_02_FULL_50_50]|uniref:N-acetyltransferase domain-containing protein n=1 Tax=Candidatus Kaiserbacteria bacterium RIFCSPHIGHO2_02_FULL_50_50 TaxID=1798492 RepID=A0A1F6DDF5_9BACT|nr:MAG: hypothetical protein A3C89_01485 [Candidatus Kaiserbacteria bacterium RIFCSPHIGHO2_02_FULL_50_50]OGG89314.1 MAG: hypothetical protein A3G62_01560 [Candidatus Kaiserbacteria bacterium RIFCSPLOWO2_12_FULL_50_10]
MDHITIAEPSSPHYEEALTFALRHYLERHNCSLEVRPDFLAIAYAGNSIIGTLGLITTSTEPYFFEQSEPKGAAETLLCGEPRNTLGELTRFTLREGTSPREALEQGKQLTACLCAYVYARGIRHIGFVGKRSFCSILERLAIPYAILGTPTLEDIPRELLGTYPAQHNLYAIGFSLDRAPSTLHA